MYRRYRNGKAAYKNKENGIAIILCNSDVAIIQNDGCVNLAHHNTIWVVE